MTIGQESRILNKKGLPAVQAAKQIRQYNTEAWSSTENSSTNAWNLNFNNGDRWNNNKYNNNYVRPVLAFLFKSSGQN